jgi:hypothetical protein
MHDPDHSAHHGNPLDKLPDDLARRVQDELTQDEHLLWAGQPRPDLYAGGSSIPVIMGFFCLLVAGSLLLIPLGVGLCLGIGGAVKGKDALAGIMEGGICSLPFLLFAMVGGLPFAAMGYFMVTIPRRNREFARRSCYALTNRRAITFVAGAWGAMLVRSYAPEQLEDLFRVELADGAGSLIFQEALMRTGARHRSVSTRRYGFLCIDHVHRVEDLIRTNLLRAS